MRSPSNEAAAEGTGRLVIGHDYAFVEHDYAFVEKVSDRIDLVANGKLAMEGMSKGAGVFWLVVVVAGAAFGALYGAVLGEDFSIEGVIYGISIGLLVVSYERGLLFPRYNERLRRLPTLAYLAAAEASLLVLVLLIQVVAGSLMWSVGIAGETLADVLEPELSAIAYSMLISALFVFTLRVRDLIGAGVFTDLMVGKYHRPVVEDRAFLFLDLVGSTSFAEKHGDLEAQELLRAVFAAIAEPVRRHRGQIDDYVGDLAIVSWPLATGVEKGRCIACVFAVNEALRRDRARWIARFGHVPELRAALHGGSVVTAEIGVDRHKITYFGDVMNATARLERLCRDSGRAILISEELLARVSSLPVGVVTEPLGEHTLRGRDEDMKVHALTLRQHGAERSAAPVVA